MRSALTTAALLAAGIAACDPAAAVVERPPPERPAPGALSLERGCACAVDPRGGRRDQVDCRAAGLPEGSALCQLGPNGIYCGPVGENPATFIGTVGCGDGFCASADGDSCLFTCGCE